MNNPKPIVRACRKKGMACPQMDSRIPHGFIPGKKLLAIAIEIC